MNTRHQNSLVDADWARIQDPWCKAGNFLLLCVLPLWGAWQLGGVFIVLLVIYFAVSKETFKLYRIDKSNARNSFWRTPEIKLHFTELMGGWPGALLAQQAFRHKTSKSSYQQVFWMIVVVHQVFWVDQLFNEGRLFSLLIGAIAAKIKKFLLAPSG